MSMDTKYKLLWVFLGGLLIGFIIGHAIARNTGDADSVLSESEQEAEEMVLDATSGDDAPLVRAGESEVHVKDQQSGDMVFVSRVATPAQAWVVIQDSNEWILGAQRFESGISQGNVELLRNTVPNETYSAILWVDNGDGVFDHESDEPHTPLAGMTFSTYE